MNAFYITGKLDRQYMRIAACYRLLAHEARLWWGVCHLSPLKSRSAYLTFSGDTMAQTGKRPTIYSASPSTPAPAPKAYVHDRPARLINEWQACHEEKARLAIRHRLGSDWDGESDNDNDPDKGKKFWPLAKALLDEGNKDLLKYAIAYRRIYDMAKSEAVLGGSAPEREMNLEQRVTNQDNESIPKGTRKLTAGNIDTPPTRKVPVDPLMPSGNGSSVPKPWNGDAAVNDMIDAKRQLVRLQAAVGSILDPFEMMVVDGATLKDAGHAAGASSRDGAPAAGRAIAHMGLIAVRDRLGRLERKDLAS